VLSTGLLLNGSMGTCTFLRLVNLKVFSDSVAPLVLT
jgi:hypothetical protein